jgi:hypothetical protein
VAELSLDRAEEPISPLPGVLSQKLKRRYARESQDSGHFHSSISKGDLAAIRVQLSEMRAEMCTEFARIHEQFELLGLVPSSTPPEFAVDSDQMVE